MKKTLSILAAAAVMAVAFSCTKDGKQDPTDGMAVTVSLQADQEFSGGRANLTVSLSAATWEDVTVNLAVSDKAEGAISAEYVNFESPVTIEKGKTSKVVNVTLSGTHEKDGTVTILIASARGAKADSTPVVINFKSGYSGGDEGEGEGGSSEGGSTWKVSYEGYQEVQFQGGADMCEVFKTSGTGSATFYFAIADEGTYASFNGNIETLKSQAEDWLQQDLNDLAAEGWTIDDLVVAEDPHYEYYNGLEEGTIEVFIFGMSKDGVASGEYAYATITISEDHTGGQGGGGEEEKYVYDVIAVNGTGESLFYFDVYEHGSVNETNVADVLLELAQMCNDEYELYNEYFPDWGVERTDFMYDSEYNSYEYEELALGQWDVVIAGMDADGNLTGEYSISTVTVDGHEYVSTGEYSMNRKKAMLRRNALKARKAGLRGEFQPTIPETLVPNTAWQAEYLGRYEEDYGGLFSETAVKKRTIKK